MRMGAAWTKGGNVATRTAVTSNGKIKTWRAGMVLTLGSDMKPEYASSTPIPSFPRRRGKEEDSLGKII